MFSMVGVFLRLHATSGHTYEPDHSHTRVAAPFKYVFSLHLLSFLYLWSKLRTISTSGSRKETRGFVSHGYMKLWDCAQVKL